MRHRPGKEFPNRIRQALSLESETEIAQLLDLPQPLVHRYFTLSVAPCYLSFAKMAALKINLNWLVSGKKFCSKEGPEDEEKFFAFWNVHRNFANRTEFDFYLRGITDKDVSEEIKARSSKRPDGAFRDRILLSFPGLTGSEVARSLKVPQPLMFKYLNLNAAPCYDFFFKVASLDIDVNWLIDGHHLPRMNELDINEYLEAMRLYRYFQALGLRQDAVKGMMTLYEDRMEKALKLKTGGIRK